MLRDKGITSNWTEKYSSVSVTAVETFIDGKRDVVNSSEDEGAEADDGWDNNCDNDIHINLFEIED